MADYTKWIPVCRWCGERNVLKIGEKKGETPPLTPPPAMSGRCSASPTGWHEPRWERWK